jgi:DNA-directed RNA polymerase specialized sigma24 family protein
MLRRKTDRKASPKTDEYATRSDFHEIFREETAGLHLLAFLLTAEAEKAEQCFVAGLDNSVRGNAVFREWARSWSKRAIIKNAIKAISPAPPRAGIALDADLAEAGPQQPGTQVTKQNAGETGCGWNGTPAEKALIAAVTRLHSFDRFVLVMAVLEGYPVRECAALLGRTVPEVAAAKARALEQMGPAQAGLQADRLSNSETWTALLAPAQTA